MKHTQLGDCTNCYDLPHGSFSCFSTSAVKDMVKEIQDFEGLQALRLEGNTVGVEAAQEIAKALETKSEFKVCKTFLIC